MTVLCQQLKKVGHTHLNIECHTHVLLNHVLLNLIQECGKFLCLHSKMFVEEAVPWLMVVFMKKMLIQFKEFLPKISWIIILETKHHFHYFSIRLGFSNVPI